ncbi:RHS repeat-associated core domain-containing protein [Roseivirga sp. BDSF3-8]|uniref:RHS repeat-associated core domain-containing protein n=1 Tax=Roseivirga sp. BDSF3-8 TaxID=3241598 RepID=UPI003531CA6E
MQGQIGRRRRLGPPSGFYSTQYREYGAALGRFHAIDPMASKFAAWTPYMYGYNNTVNANDPDGAQAAHRASGGQYDLTNPVPVEYQIFFHDPVGGTRVGKRNSTMPASGNHWTDRTLTDPDYLAQRDYFLLPNREFGDKYGIDQSQVVFVDGKIHIKEWDSTGGDPITKEEWLKRGGNLEDLEEDVAYTFFGGDWKITPVLDSNGNKVTLSPWFGVGLGLFEEGMDIYGEFKTVVIPIYGKSGKAIAGWNVMLKSTGKTLTILKTGASKGGYILAGAGFVLDTMDFVDGDISAARYGYRTTGTAAAIVAGAFISAGVGAIVGAVFVVGECAYDWWMDDVQPVIDQGNRDLINGLKGGWRPFRR